jgi:hypothetical protein
MKTQSDPVLKEKEEVTITLDKMLSNLLWVFQPIAAKRSSFIINDVPPEFYIHTDHPLLERTLGSLLTSVISRSRNSCIRVSAKRYKNIVLLRIKDNKGNFSYDLEKGLCNSQLMAEQLGGCIVANDLRKKTATITLTFRNALQVA